jgi:hypothetical protein
MYFLVTCPVRRYVYLDAGHACLYAYVRTVFYTVAKLPLYIAVCAVLCQPKLMLGAYCVGIRWLLTFSVHWQTPHSAVKKVWRSIEFWLYIYILKCEKFNVIEMFKNYGDKISCQFNEKRKIIC